MNSRGRGILSPTPKDPNAANAKPGATSSAWADFMKEEGVDLYGAKQQDDNPDSAAATAGSSNATSDNPDHDKKKKAAATTTKKKSSNKRKSYNLQVLESSAAEPASKKAKTAATAGGALVQSATLVVTVVGRKALSKENPSYQIQTPTRILPGIGITKVFTSCNACHSIALDVSGQAYGWGRNDSGQLTKDLGANVATPTLLEGLADQTIVSAAVGKFHTLVLTNEGTVLAVGSNKVGQCGIKSSTESLNQFKPCVFPPNVKIAQVGTCVPYKL